MAVSSLGYLLVIRRLFGFIKPYLSKGLMEPSMWALGLHNTQVMGLTTRMNPSMMNMRDKGVTGAGQLSAAPSCLHREETTKGEKLAHINSQTEEKN